MAYHRRHQDLEMHFRVFGARGFQVRQVRGLLVVEAFAYGQLFHANNILRDEWTRGKHPGQVWPLRTAQLSSPAMKERGLQPGVLIR